jgi:hypothetical protein
VDEDRTDDASYLPNSERCPLDIHVLDGNLTATLETVKVGRKTRGNALESGTPRVLLAIFTYFLVVAYCCIWVPWSVTSLDRYGTEHERPGYGWIWAGPRYPRSEANASSSGTKADFTDIEDFASEQKKRLGVGICREDRFVAHQTRREARSPDSSNTTRESPTARQRLPVLNWKTVTL